MDKSADAYRTISEVAEELDVPQHVLRFWETRFLLIKPLKRAGGRRFYRPRDIDLLRAIKQLLYGEGYTIKGVQRILKEQGARAVIAANQAGSDFSAFATRDLPLPRIDAASKEDRCEQDLEAGASENRSTPSGAPGVGSWPAASLDPDGATGPGPGRPTTLLVKDAARLRAALSELEECERILEAIRRL